MNHTEIRQILHEKYMGFSFPDCFFQFHDFVTELQSVYGIDINRSALQIRLGNVFNIFKPGFDKTNLHPWKESRYPNDPPEFFTMIHGNSDGLHWGYYVEDENAPRIMVVSYFHREVLNFKIDGLNLHEAVRGILEQSYADNLAYSEVYPNDAAYQQNLQQLDRIRRVLMKYYTADRPEEGKKYLQQYDYVSDEQTATRDGLGFTMPADKYAPFTAAAMFLDPAFTPDDEQVEQYKTEVVDLLEQGFPGAALQLGRDLWCYEVYRSAATELLAQAYRALNRPRALQILSAIKNSGSAPRLS